MKTMKVIDLLNKIANGKEVPKKIKWEDIIYVYSEPDKDYLEYPFSVDEYRGLFNMKDSILTQYLNDEIEIIEDILKVQVEMTQKEYNEYLDRKLNIPKEDKKIEDRVRFQYSQIPLWSNMIDFIRITNENFEKHQKVLNEIIDKINGEE